MQLVYFSMGFFSISALLPQTLFDVSEAEVSWCCSVERLANHKGVKLQGRNLDETK